MDYDFLSLFEKIQVHVSSKGILKKRPGIELYEVAAIELIISTVDNTHYNGDLKSNEVVSAQFWEKIFSHQNTELLQLVWLKVIRVVQNTHSMMLYDLAFMTAISKIGQQVNDPYLQEAVYGFLNNAINEMEKDSEYIQYTFSKEEEKSRMCMHILSQLYEQLKTKTFYPRGEFFRLFGKLFGVLLRRHEVCRSTRENLKFILFKESF